MTYEEWKQKRRSDLRQDIRELISFEKLHRRTANDFRLRAKNEEKKRSEIMAIKNRDERVRKIAKNLDLF